MPRPIADPPDHQARLRKVLEARDAALKALSESHQRLVDSIATLREVDVEMPTFDS